MKGSSLMRLRTYDGQFYGSASDKAAVAWCRAAGQDVLEGLWYHMGQGDNVSWPVCECPSFFPLPGGQFSRLFPFENQVLRLVSRRSTMSPG